MIYYLKVYPGGRGGATELKPKLERLFSLVILIQMPSANHIRWDQRLLWHWRQRLQRLADSWTTEYCNDRETLMWIDHVWPLNVRDSNDQIPSANEPPVSLVFGRCRADLAHKQSWTCWTFAHVDMRTLPLCCSCVCTGFPFYLQQRDIPFWLDGLIAIKGRREVTNTFSIHPLPSFCLTEAEPFYYRLMNSRETKGTPAW